ncbi:F-box protein [Medicago truncatula]|uniref:F-box protein n=1 Tax=Medicago truncatula TaxID=3880 RepID=G7JQJ8_MEDTR|nr:F-box protein [Medicago truncatula]
MVRRRRSYKFKDLVSELPDDILHRLISYLSIDEALRTSILSKRWIHLWKNAMHLDFDFTHMIKPLSQIATISGIEKYGKIVNTVLNQHIGNLTTLLAFQSCEKLKILKLKKLAMENSIINGILKNCYGLEKCSLIDSIGFNSLKIENQNLKFLELLWLNVKEIDVNVDDLQVINLLNLSSTCKPNAQGIVPSYLNQSSLKTQDILQNCSDLLRKIQIWVLVSFKDKMLQAGGWSARSG